MHLIEQSRQFRCQLRRLRRRRGRREVAGNLLGQEKLPAERRDRRRNVSGWEGIGLDVLEGEVVLVDVAERRQLRQEQRPSGALPHEGQGKRAAGASGGQKNLRGREILGRVCRGCWSIPAASASTNGRPGGIE